MKATGCTVLPSSNKDFLIIHILFLSYMQVFLNNVQCTGSEAKLSDCTASYDTLYASNLTTAGVVCQNLRLVSGGEKSSGASGIQRG